VNFKKININNNFIGSVNTPYFEAFERIGILINNKLKI